MSLDNKPKKIDEIRKKPIIRTYESDVATSMKNKKVSMVDILMAERRAKKQKIQKTKNPKIALTAVQAEVRQAEKPKKKIDRSILLKIGLIGLIIVAILFLGYGVYTIFSGESSKNGIKISDLKEVVFVNERMSLDITGLDKRRVMSKILDTKDALDPTLGTIINVYPIKKVVLGEGKEISSQNVRMNATDFLKSIGVVLPTILERTMANEFMFGFHMTGTVEPFFILKVNSFENAFAGMMKWESNIDTDLGFLIEEKLRRSSIVHATSSEEVVGLLRPFEDVVIKNRDVRIIRDKNNEDILMYSLPDRKTVVITTNRNTLIEILDRLARAKFSR